MEVQFLSSETPEKICRSVRFKLFGGEGGLLHWEEILSMKYGMIHPSALQPVLFSLIFSDTLILVNAPNIVNFLMRLQT